MLSLGDIKDILRIKLIGVIPESETVLDASNQGVPAVHLGLFATPGGNPLVIVEGIRQLLPQIRQTLPPDVKAELAFETARFAWRTLPVHLLAGDDSAAALAANSCWKSSSCCCS